MPLVKGESLAFEPGTRWSYSNTGMLVLGKVIEVVTKQDYFDYVREHVSKPAGMIEHRRVRAGSGQPEPRRRLRARVRGRRHEAIPQQHLHARHPRRAGGGRLLDRRGPRRFAEALKAGKLVSPATCELLTTPKPEVNSPEYGFGFERGAETGIVGHSGGFPGISSNLDIFKGTGYVAVVMSNYGGASQPVVEKIRTLVRSRTGRAAS